MAVRYDWKWYEDNEHVEIKRRVAVSVDYEKSRSITYNDWYDANLHYRVRIGLFCVRLSDEVLGWCDQNNVVEPMMIEYEWKILFDSEEDAMLFKLRWL